MSTGIAIHIGLNNVDPSAYGGWNGQLAGCLNDAAGMRQISTSFGYSATTIVNADATAAAVLQAIGDAASQLGPEDILLLTYSGHGGRVPFADADHPDGQDDTWVLYDRMVLGHELYLKWGSFAAGARIFVLSDSCHSGTVLRDWTYSNPLIGNRHKEVPLAVLAARGVPPSDFAKSFSKDVAPGHFRVIPPDVLSSHLQQNSVKYRAIKDSIPRDVSGAINATVLLISGCQDNQTSQDGTDNGLFTQRLLEVWSNGSFVGDYPTFKQQIVQRMPPEQTPNYFIVGVNNPGFEAQKPFSVEAPAAQPTNAVPARPSVSVPAQLSRTDAAPTFAVVTGANQFYEFEMTSQPELFDSSAHSADQTSSNFWASWATATSHTSSPSFQLPDAAWQALNGNDRLYYRIITSSSSTTWANVAASSGPGDDVSTPRLDVSDAPS
jgi:hypothetical protein